MLTLFSEPQTDVEYSPSRIPCSWRISYILMCFTGVNNVFFMPSLPRCLRMTSLVYHAVWLCISAPVVVLYIYNIKWGTSMNSFTESVSVLTSCSYLMTLGTINMVNALKANRTPEFLKKWSLLCSNKTIRCENIEFSRYRNVRVALVVIFLCLITLDVAVNVRYLLHFDWAVCGTVMFPSLTSSSHISKAVCMIYHTFGYFSLYSVILTVVHFALVTLTLADEFDKLYQVICQYQSSQCTGVSAWEQVRFHHEELISLACLHGQLSTMLLGPILVGNVVFVCFNLYYVLTVHAGVLGVINVIVATAILSIIIVSSSILEHEVSEMSIKYTKLCTKWPQFWRRYFEMFTE